MTKHEARAILKKLETQEIEKCNGNPVPKKKSFGPSTDGYRQGGTATVGTWYNAVAKFSDGEIMSFHMDKYPTPYNIELEAKEVLK